ncbi:MAG: WD40 repeat domain-containing protein [Trebonia sp.]
MTASRSLESYLFRPATGTPQSGKAKEETKADEEERVRRDFIRRGQPVFDMVAGLVASGDVGALELLYSGSTPLHEIIADNMDFPESAGFAARAGVPFRPGERAGVHAARVLGGLGLTLTVPEPAEKALYSALAWYTEARSSVAAPGWGPRDIAKAQPRLLPLAELLSSATGDERWAAGALTIAVTLRALAAPGGKRARQSGIAVLMAGRSEEGKEGVRARLQMSVVPGLPPGLVADPGRMALFAADLAFRQSLARAWAQAGTPRAGGTVLWSIGAEEGPVPSIEGESAGGAFAVVLDEVGRLSMPLAEARVIRRLKGDNAVIGRIDDRGDLQGVEGYDSKLNALDNHAKVIVPEADLAKARNAAKGVKLEIVPATHWKDAARSARQANTKVLLRQGLAVVLVIALGVGLYAWRQHRQADREGHLADTSTFAADSGRLAAQSQVTGATDPVLARLEAVAAWRLDHTPAAGYAMLKAAALPPMAILDDSGTAFGPFAFSGDNRLLAAALNNGDIKVWDTATRRLTTTLTGGDPYNAATAMTFSPDTSLVAVGADTKVELWDMSSRRLTSLETKGPVENIAFSRDGALLAVITNNTAVQVWDVRTRRLSMTFPQSSPGQDEGVAFSPSGGLLAVGTQDGVQLWNLATSQLVTTLRASSANPGISVAFSPDSRELAAGTVGGVQVWDVARGQLMTTLPLGKNDLAGSVAFSSDGSRLTIRTNTDVGVWDVARGQLINSAGSPDGLTVSPDFSLAASATQNGTLQLVNVAAKSVLSRQAATLPPADPDDLSSIAFSPNGRLLAAAGSLPDGGIGGPKGGTSQGIRLWNATTHDVVATLKAANDAPVDSMAFSPDNRLLAAGTVRDGTQVWNVTTRQLVTTLNSDSVEVSAVAFNGHGLLAVGTDGDGVQLWDVATGQLVATLGLGPVDVSAVAFSPISGLLAVGTTGSGPNMGMGHRGDGIEVWNTATHERVSTLMTGTDTQVTKVVFSRSGSLLAATGEGTQVWNVSSKQLTSSFGSSSAWVAFTQDGTVAAIPSTSGIQLWDTATGQLASTLPDDDTNAGSLPMTFSPDDTLLAAGANRGSVQLWQVPYLADTAGYLCSVAGESFPPADWARYAPGIAYQKTCS